MGSWSFGADFHEFSTGIMHQRVYIFFRPAKRPGCIRGCVFQVQYVFIDELLLGIIKGIAAGFHTMPVMKKGCGVRPENGIDFLFFPGIESTFAVLCRVVRLLAVSVFGRKETAVPVGHITQNIVHGFSGDPAEKGIPAYLKSLQERDHELALVVEHLFKMGNPPLTVNGIAVEAAAENIIHPALCHCPEGLCCHFKGIVVAGTLVIAQ